MPEVPQTRPPGRSRGPRKNRLGLVCAGGASQLWIGRLDRIQRDLGPVKSAGIRAASRVVNTIRAGVAVSGYEPLAECDTILVAVPLGRLNRIVEELLHAPFSWTGKTFVVVDSFRDSGDFTGFTNGGVAVVTIDRLDDLPDPVIVMQGVSAAIRQVEGYFQESKLKTIAIEPGRKTLLLAARSMAISLAFPLLAACVETLSAAGLTSLQAQALTASWIERTRRSLARAGRKGWTGPIAERNAAEIKRQWEGLCRHHPARSEYFLRLAIETIDFYGSSPAVAAELAALAKKSAPRLRVVSGNGG